MSDVNSLKPGDIAKIEYSYITPARYADKGKNGFLSITLKEREDGGQVYLWGRSAVNTAFLDANLQASYHQGPSQFTLQYSPHGVTIRMLTTIRPCNTSAMTSKWI
jgi:NAD(P)H-hydrate repair Nnr-like enzyme with NAD(P)H-hydrate dehydratase domain